MSSPVSFTFPLTIDKFAASGDEAGGRFLRGHAAVFNRQSHDLGGYRVEIASGAFSKVLDQNPDVHLLWDHDTKLVLARTRNSTLELSQDGEGLKVFAKLAPTSYAEDLAVLMERGDVDQMSFACDIGSDTWTQVGEGDSAEITRTINEVSALYDVTVCAQGAFPQTESALAADLASAIEAGRVPGRTEVVASEDGEDAVDQEGADPVAAPADEADEQGGSDVAPVEEGSEIAATKDAVRRRMALFDHATEKES